jgi:hypothetical protein
MGKVVALDSNSLTYLLDAVRDGYLPQTDPASIAPPRLAMFRLFCYSTCSLWVSPTVRTEYLRITDPAKRESHDRWVRYQLEDLEPTVPAHVFDRRVSELNRRHADLDDCRIVAEAEAASADILLTSDGELIIDLGDQTGVALIQPTEFLASLAIPAGSAPRTVPAAGNPLSTETWWRL